MCGVCVSSIDFINIMCARERNRKSDLAPMPSSVGWNFTHVRHYSEKNMCHTYPYNCSIVKSRHWNLKATKIPLCEDILNICHRRKDGREWYSVLEKEKTKVAQTEIQRKCNIHNLYLIHQSLDLIIHIYIVK